MLVDTQIPWMLMRSTLSRLAEEKGHRIRVMGVSSAVEHIFNETAMHARAHKQSSGKGKQSNSWSNGEPSFSGKSKSKENKKNSKRKSRATKSSNQGVKSSNKGKTSNTDLSSLKNAKSEASSETQESGNVCTNDTSWNDGWNGDEWNDGWNFDEWNDDWSSVGWHENWEQTYDTSASSFSLGGLDANATCSPKQCEWVKMNLETRAALNTFPLNFGPEGAGGGRFYWTASGEWTPDGGS